MHLWHIVLIRGPNPAGPGKEQNGSADVTMLVGDELPCG